MVGGEDRNLYWHQFFLSSDSWESRYKKIIDLGKDSPSFSNEEKKDDWLVPGCSSRLWLKSWFDKGHVFYSSDSDGAIVKGLSVMLCSFYSDLSPQEILVLKPQFLVDLKLQQHLTASRANGLASLLKIISYHALGYQLKNDANTRACGQLK